MQSFSQSNTAHHRPTTILPPRAAQQRKVMTEAKKPLDKNGEEGEEEAEIRALLSKLNTKDPVKVAKLWEEQKLHHSQAQSPQLRIPVEASPSAPSQAPPLPTQIVQPQGSILSFSNVIATPTQPKPSTPEQSPPRSDSLQTSNTIRLQGKEGCLTEVASEWPSNLNSDKTVHKEEMLKCPDQIPSSIQPCEPLKSLGLDFQRADLARALSHEVPEKNHTEMLDWRKNTLLMTLRADASNRKIGSPQEIANSGKKRGRAAGTDTATEKEASKRRIGPLMNAAGPEQVTLTTSSSHVIPTHDRDVSRKRRLGEVIDLTADDSNDEEMPPSKKMMPSAPEEVQDDATSKLPPPNKLSGKVMHPSIDNQSYQNSVQHVSQRDQDPPRPAPTMHTGDQQHPPVAASLQPHPLPESLLSKANSLTQEQIQYDRVHGKILVEPIKRNRDALKSEFDSCTLASDVLLGTGRHPDMPPLNEHMMVMDKLLARSGGKADSGGNRSDLSTIRWDIIDPDHSPRSRPANVQPFAVSTTMFDPADADDESETLEHSNIVDNGDGTTSNAAASVLSRRKGLQRRCGRPRRYQSSDDQTLSPASSPQDGSSPEDVGLRSVARRTVPKKQSSTQISATPATAPTASRATIPQGTSNATGIGYTALRRLSGKGDQIKKPGRPFGWRKAIHGRQAQGIPPTKSSTGSEDSGRPQSVVNPKEQLREPKYQIYQCRWLNCRAELHNLETLKRHVVKVHGRPQDDGLFTCAWVGCVTKPTSATGKSSSADVRFAAMKPWMEHIDHEHLQEVAWKLGDGPKGGLSSDHQDSELSETYLSDSYGRSVTPRIQPFPLSETASTVLPSLAYRPASGIAGPSHDLSRDERAAMVKLKELKEKIRTIGPTLHRTGVRLANAKRRLGFLDDEEFEDFVEESDED